MHMQKQGNNTIAKPQNFVAITSKRNGTNFPIKQAQWPMVMHEYMPEIPFSGVFCRPRLVYVCTFFKKELIALIY